MSGENTKGTQKIRKNTKEVDISSQDALILSLLSQHRRLSHNCSNGLTKPQQKVILAGMFKLISEQNVQILHLQSVIDTAKPVMQIFAEQLNKLK